ncbi:hypothetical protein K503DRAFT_853573 [Rhizopogon vinicolor AM-OR11-026]|uniref:Homeobox domain-containing protein n=1 Tax=Rhizopogon vinicolor AM-OR11-026 TaxID=1314800 RepID=A0A1B7NE08_9AGAM|nr:hypothetical protein K503DRAFT_853573 [Rhizopogon vinicolor AM-OR11-026]
MHIIIPPIATSIRTLQATTATATPDQDRDVKENISSTPSLNVSQPSPEARSKYLSSRKRNRMSSTQLARLESLFQKETHPSKEKKRELADEIGVTLTVWFQNKRQVVKRNGGNVFPPFQLRKGVSQTSPDQHVPQSPSVLQRVSSPSMEDNLQPTSLQQVSTASSRTTNSPGNQGTDVNNLPLRKLTEVKPLLSSLASFIAYKSPPSKTSYGKDQAQLELPASRISAQELWRHLSSSPATPSPTSDRGSKARDPARDEDETPCSKRRMTLEWACNRETKRRRGESHHSSDTDNLSSFWVGPSSRSITSALSLLLFAKGKVSKPSPAGSAPSPDVIRGASLLLSLKHTLRRRNAGK